MKIILVLTFFLAYQSYGYDLDRISVSDYEFRRYVRPQLRSMTNEFQTLFFAVNPTLENYRPLSSTMRELAALNHDLQRKCSATEVLCLEELRKSERLLSAALKALDQIKEKALAQNEVATLFDHRLELLSQNFLDLLAQTQNEIFRVSFIQNSAARISAYANRASALNGAFYSHLFKQSDPLIREEFSAFWANFIRPAEGYVLQENNIDYFKRQLGELNIRFNMFNVALTKRNFQPNKQAATLLNIMHRRWNNILKVSLNPKG